MVIVGGISDQIALLIWPRVTAGFFELLPQFSQSSVYSHAFYYLTNSFHTNQPILWTFLSVFLSVFGSSFYNVFLVLTVSLNLWCSYILFRRYYGGLVYALIFSFSSYMWVHLGPHPAITQIWLIPLFIHMLLKYEEKEFSFKNAGILGVILGTTILISNYLGFFLLIFFTLYFLFDIKKLGRVYLFSIVVACAISFFFLIPYLKTNYLSSVTNGIGYTVRPFEDFIYFSSRPWYFAIPPLKNPLLGEIGIFLVDKIASGGYFLADDYFAKEHMANYLGFGLYIVLAISLGYTFVQKDKRRKVVVFKLLAISGVFLLLMLPPYFTISGVTFWTPGYLLYRVFPMFRVTSRMSVVVLPIFLLIIGMSLTSISNERRFRWLKFTSLFLLLFVLVETYVPLKLVVEDNPPDGFVYMEKNISIGSRFIVYPNGNFLSAFYWLPVHQGEIVNTESEVFKDFAEDLLTKEGLDKMVSLGVKYLALNGQTHGQYLNFLKENAILLNEESLNFFIFELR